MPLDYGAYARRVRAYLGETEHLARERKLELILGRLEASRRWEKNGRTGAGVSRARRWTAAIALGSSEYTRPLLKLSELFSIRGLPGDRGSSTSSTCRPDQPTNRLSYLR